MSGKKWKVCGWSSRPVHCGFFPARIRPNTVSPATEPVPVHASVASPAVLAVAGVFSPLLREIRETAYQFRAPFVIDASKFEATFGGLEPTPHRDAVQLTVAWYRSR